MNSDIEISPISYRIDFDWGLNREIKHDAYHYYYDRIAAYSKIQAYMASHYDYTQVLLF